MRLTLVVAIGLLIGILLIGCKKTPSGSNEGAPTSGSNEGAPTSFDKIINGPTQAEATTHWQGDAPVTNRFKIAFYSDGTGRYHILIPHVGFFIGSVAWSQTAPTTILVFPTIVYDATVHVNVEISAFTGISGSVDSGAFRCTITAQAEGFTNDQYPGTFHIVSEPIPVLP